MTRPNAVKIGIATNGIGSFARVLGLDNNTAKRVMRSVAVGQKNYLFVGSQAGGRAAAIVYTLIETAS